MADGQRGAKITVNPRIGRSLLGEDLAKSLLGLAQLTCQDFQQSVHHFEDPLQWRPPFDGMFLTKWREFGADEVQSILEQAGLIFSTLAHSGEPKDPPTEEFVTPRTSEEENFKRAVRATVLASAPDLEKFFDNKVSATTGSEMSFDVDYFSSSLTACFSTINPKSPRKFLLSRHHAALWRVARSRDFGLFRPAAAELIVWHPEPGLPMFSVGDYMIAKEIEMELVYEARKEGIEVVPQFRDTSAAAHLIKRERELALSH